MTPSERNNLRAQTELDEGAYVWQRATTARDRSVSFTHPASHSASGRTSPAKDGAYEYDDTEDAPLKDDYDDLLGYSADFLSSMLSPQRALCHQKFELVVDDLCFIGHPVCAEAGGTWRFKPEVRQNARGRGSKKRQPSGEELSISQEVESPDSRIPSLPPVQESAWLHTFHVVFVHDLPDTSSSASGNIEKYFDVIYEQIAFTLTAVLFQEQVLSNFVESECETLGALKDEYAAKGKPLEEYMSSALKVSSIASAMKTLYEAIKSRSLAHLTVHSLPLELQLPPYLDSLLHSEDDLESGELTYQGDEMAREHNPWGRELSFAWRLPSLDPWKSLLLLETEDNSDVYMSLRNSNIRDEDRLLAEQLIKFLEMADVTLSFVDMSSLLDWDLETQVFPIVRWLIHHRRAKIVDIVHRELKTVFTLPSKFEAPLKELSAEFKQAFPHSSVPSLPKLLATISTSSTNHFYGTVVKTKDLLPIYLDVVLWMLKRDLLVTLHLRVRIVVPAELKERARSKWRTRRRQRRKSFGKARNRILQEKDIDADEEKPLDTLFGSPKWLPLSPKGARERARRGSVSQESENSDIVSSPIPELEEENDVEDKDGDDETGKEDEELGREKDDRFPSVIIDPGRATVVEKLWLREMSEGKNEILARRFQQINQFFDGKCTDDEILYRAEISRKQLREVLHHYDEYLQTFMHPS
ncbi:hypothetical protein EWM64_g5411 [Hericium alpestre]|uniref:Nitrogen permease regulator 3 n=1 Tax=Hericium alpestre TaxID=135208 RepID=A0A4Y9ZXH1_9AGAM|nr:hypothetical protein EWM64_g5411 [Hericium alpestre]